MRKALTTQVENYGIFFKCVDIANQLLSVTRLWRYCFNFFPFSSFMTVN